MNRYQRIVEYLDSLPAKNRRLCRVVESGGRCACLGCVNNSPLNIRQHHLDKYESGELQKIASDSEGLSDG